MLTRTRKISTQQQWEALLETGDSQTNLVCGKNRILNSIHDEWVFYLHDDKFILISLNGVNNKLDEIKNWKPKNNSYAIIGVQYKNGHFLIDADDNNYGPVFTDEYSDSLNNCPNFKSKISVSFGCVQELLNKKPEVVFSDNSFKVLDVVSDNNVKIDKKTSLTKITDLLKQGYSCLRCPEYRTAKQIKKCMSELYGEFSMHRPATLLFSYQKNRYLLGMDDSQYFGVQLPKNSRASNLNQAYEDLKPERVQLVGENFLRQGEWFLVPCSENDVTTDLYNITQVCVILRKGSSYDLARDDVDSNIHTISVDRDAESTRIVCTDTDTYFINGIHWKMSHIEHRELNPSEMPIPTVAFGNWFMLIRNTAVKSVSQNGVD